MYEYGVMLLFQDTMDGYTTRAFSMHRINKNGGGNHFLGPG